MKKMKLFMVLLGASPKGRFTEQHDIFFGIAEEVHQLLPEMIAFWPEAGRKLHVDGWREVANVDGYEVEIVNRNENTESSTARLFFINLGGYKKDEFEEYHYKMIVAGEDKGTAIKAAKETAFYKHTRIKGAESHIDDKYGVDVDDMYEITDILSKKTKDKFSIVLKKTDNSTVDPINLGYLSLAKLEAMF